MNRFVMDAYAWIEYFDGSIAGEKVRKIIEDPENIIHTNIVTLAELSSHFARKNSPFREARAIILSLSAVYLIDLMFVEEVGKIHAEIKPKHKHMGLADVFVLLTAKRLKAKIVTGDEDFRDFPETVMIK